MKLPLDELHNFETYIKEYTEDNIIKLSVKEAEDAIEDILILSYVYGVQYVNETLNTDVSIDFQLMNKAMYMKFDNKDFTDRVSEYMADNKVEDLIKVAETDSHRIFNTAIYETALKTKKKLVKTWETMLDNRVRDTHSYLEGITIPLDSTFSTYDGDSALYPGDFSLAENNINCRCVITIREDLKTQRTR